MGRNRRLPLSLRPLAPSLQLDHTMTLTRRRLLKGSLGSAAAAWLDSCSAPASAGCRAAAELQLGVPPDSVPVDVRLKLTARRREVNVVADRPTPVWRYEATLTHGPAAALDVPTGSAAETWVGPSLRLRQGQRVQIDFENRLPEPSIVHWHGLDVPQASDGHPRLAVGSGEHYRYDFVVQNRAGSYWFHPHPHGRTAPQVYAGLAGLLIVSDDEEAALGLPTGEYERSLVIQDRTLEGSQFLYQPNVMEGFLGDEVYVNGKPNPSFEVKAGSYRLRLLNGSNSRVYKLAFDDGTPLTVIGTDGGLLEAPVTKPFVVLAPAQRVELWVDFGGLATGTRRQLQSSAFTLPSPMMGMGGRMRGMGRMGGGSTARVPNGAPMPICSFAVTGPGERKQLPPRLTPLSFPARSEVASVRRVALQMAHMNWTLNGRTFSMNGVADSERFTAGEVVDWLFDNTSSMMSMAHPMHVHGTQFHIVERDRTNVAANVLDSLKDGLLDEGFQDTVLVLPGERVRVRQRITSFPGLYLYHCHNLEHEDQGMMRNYCVEAPA